MTDYKAREGDYLRFIVSSVSLLAYCVGLACALAWYCWHWG